MDATPAFVSRFSDKRFALPIILVCAVLAIVVNEVTYDRAAASVSSALGVVSAEGRVTTPVVTPDLRTSIDDALWINRLSVTTLILLGTIALTFYVRYLRLYDQEHVDRRDVLEEQVRRRTVELSELAGYLLTAREDEKAHLARELHDELGGLLTAAKLDMARMRARLSADPWMLERIGSINQRLNEGIALKRRIVEDLRPSSLDTLGLTVSLASLCAEVGTRLEIAIGTDFDEVRLTPEGHLAIYRLVQEALTNVGKYAQASHVTVSVKNAASCVRVRIEDDGIGFDSTVVKSATHGIAGMRFRIERLKGSMSVESRVGAGTKLEALLPSTLPN